MLKIWIRFCEPWPCFEDLCCKEYAKFRSKSDIMPSISRTDTLISTKICMITTLGHAENLNKILWPWPSFEGHCWQKYAKFRSKSDIMPNISWTDTLILTKICMNTTLGHAEYLNKILWPWHCFEGHCWKNMLNFDQKMILCPISPEWKLWF